MKANLILYCSLFICNALCAQPDSSQLKRTIRNGMTIRPHAPIPVRQAVSFQQEVTDSLDHILGRYTSFPDVAATWMRIKLEMENYLMGLWKAGRLTGVKADQAFYVNMGPGTMTAADIAQHVKIAVAGFAPDKPAEFIVVKLKR